MLSHWLISLVDGWAGLYQDHTSAQVVMQFLHIGGLMAAGGLALASDRTTLRVASGDRSARSALMEAQRGIHTWVLGALASVVLSGVSFFLADRDTYLHSVPFYLKMCAVGLLLANGGWMLHLERACIASPLAELPWKRLRLAAGASIALWFLTALLGTVLTNAA
jgi:hypothetical protein